MTAYEFTKVMKIIENKIFFGRPGVYSILESYDNPEQDLTIGFREIANEFGRRDYYAEIREKDSGVLRVRVHFTLDDNNPNKLDVGNIEPFLKADEKGKMVHTSITSDETGLDLGRRGVAWMKRKLKDFAESQGFHIEKITSATRYTGARAFNNKGSDDFGMPKHFDVNKTLKEIVVYESKTDSTKLFVVEELV